MPRYKLTIQYMGENYCGSQFQPNSKTIQGELIKAVSTLTKQKTNTIFQGRTDAGVSAKGQTLHFDYDKLIDKNKFLYSLNALLPNDIKVVSISEVDKKFHAQMSAKSRHYQYKIRNAEIENIFDRTTLHVRTKLDCKRMNEMLSYIKGEHDFSVFKSSCENPATVCKIYEARVTKQGSLIKIDIIGNRFLYNMVRTIVGTLLMFEKDKIAPSAMETLIKSKDRSQAGPTAPAVGLTLIKVNY